MVRIERALLYRPVIRLAPILVNHEMNVGGAAVVITRVDSSHLNHTVCVGVPTTTEPALQAVEITARVCAVITKCIG